MTDWQPYFPYLRASGIWLAGTFVGWWLCRRVARSLNRGGANGRLGKWTAVVAFIVVQAVLVVGCLEVAGARVSLSGVLDFPIVARESDPLLTKNILFAAVWLLGGIVLSGWLARRVRISLSARKVNPTSANMVQKLVFYLLFLTVTLAALQELHVPMGSFAFLGGAAALGVGFGAQNLINNFISGWILLAERPVRLGDTVEVAGHQGRVEAIGARCTHLRRADGVDLMIPNSALLENTVLNRTLRDDLVRAIVRVGAAYGSSAESVAGLIRRAIDENPHVLRDPEPDVLFADFGDNALLFDAYFWLHSTATTPTGRVCSQIRFRIDALFREAGVAMPFPQRDVHLDTVKPLEVRVVEGGK